MSRKFITKYENGQIRSITTTLNGVLDGEWREWFSTGILWYRAFYRNGTQVYLNYGDAKNPLSKSKSVLHVRIIHKRSIILYDFLISDLADSLSVCQESNCRV